MENKSFFSKIGAKKLYLAIGGVLLVAVVAGAMFLPGTLFRGALPWGTELRCKAVPANAVKGSPVTWVAEIGGPLESDFVEVNSKVGIVFWTGDVGENGEMTIGENPTINESVTSPVQGSSIIVTYPSDYSSDTAKAKATLITDLSGADTLRADCQVNFFDGIITIPEQENTLITIPEQENTLITIPEQENTLITIPENNLISIDTLDPLTIDCVASPNPATVGEEVSWTATAQGGSGSYDYVWYDTSDPAVNGKTTQSVKTTYTAADDSKSVNLIVTDHDNNALSDGATCTVKVEAAPPQVPPITASCSVTPTTIKSGDTVTWTANTSGGDGSYTYLWLGDKIDNKTSKSVQALFTQKPLTDLFKVIVTSAGMSKIVTCPVLKFETATPPVTPPDEEDDEEETGEPSQCPGVNYPVDIEGHWAEDYIKRGYDYCLFKGVGGKFFPDRNATRIEAASMILYSKDKNPSSACTTLACLTPFNDLQNEDQGAILNPLYFESLIEGYPNNQFRPQTLITRAEGASLIVRAFFEPYGPSCYDPHCGAGWPDNFFLDITETWQGKYIRVLWDLRIMTGAGPNRVEPNRSITRAEMAKMIVLAYEETH